MSEQRVWVEVARPIIAAAPPSSPSRSDELRPALEAALATADRPGLVSIATSNRDA